MPAQSLAEQNLYEKYPLQLFPIFKVCGLLVQETIKPQNAKETFTHQYKRCQIHSLIFISADLGSILRPYNFKRSIVKTYWELWHEYITGAYMTIMPYITHTSRILIYMPQ